MKYSCYSSNQQPRISPALLTTHNILHTTNYLRYFSNKHTSISNTMSGKDPYIFSKLHEQHEAQNVSGRKQKCSSSYVLASTPKRLRTAFTDKLSTAKKTANDDSATSRSMRSSSNGVASLSSDGKHNTKTSFTPAPSKGRPKKGSESSASSSAGAPVPAPSDVTPSTPSQ